MIHQRKILKAIAYAILLCFTSLTGAQPLYAVPANDHLPIGPNNDHKPELIAGAPVEVSSSTYPTSQMEIVQQWATSVLQWKDFSIGADATVNFSREGGGSFNSFNYVNGGNVSEIYGQLNAIGGNIFIANPSGVQIGNSAQINVGSLYATTKGFDKNDFTEIAKMTDGAAIGNYLSTHGTITNPAAELMSLGSITSATNVTFDGGRIVLDTDRLFSGENGVGTGAMNLDNLTIQTTDKEEVVLGYTEGENKPNLDGFGIKLTTVNDDGTTTAVDDTAKVDHGYQWVRDLDELRAIGKDLNGWYALRNAIDANYTQKETFDPIGTNAGSAFKGRFDGLGYNIFGLTIGSDTNKKDNAGLFGYAGDGAYIRNFTINGGTITGNNNVGAAVGAFGPGALISNITNTADVSGKTNVGGVVGSGTGEPQDTELRDLVNIGSVNGETNVGGIIGSMENVTIAGETYNLGAVTGTTGNVGGIAGKADNSIIGNELKDGGAEAFQIYNQLNVTGGWNVGGIVGELTGDSKITNAANHGDVLAKGAQAEECKYHQYKNSAWSNATGGDVNVANAGGIAGNVKGTSNGSRATIENVQNDGDVKTASDETETYDYKYEDEKGNEYTGSDGLPIYNAGNVGGIVGRAEYADIINAENMENNVAGAHNVGGVAGYLQDGNVSDSINDGGDITATGAWDGSKHVTERVRAEADNETVTIGNIGGVVGYLYGNNARIENAANRGTVHSTYIPDGATATPTVSQAANVGGVVGKVSMKQNQPDSEIAGNELLNDLKDGSVQATITNSYNTGDVLGYTGVGGVAGQMVRGSITESYNLGDVSTTRISRLATTDPVNMGGVVGDTSVSDDGDGTVIYDVYNAGKIGDETYQYYGRHVGGVVGRLGGTLEKAYNTGEIYNGYSVTGGVVGYWYSADIKNVFNTGNVTVKNYDLHARNSLVGGIVGAATTEVGKELSYAYNLGTLRSFIPEGYLEIELENPTEGQPAKTTEEYKDYQNVVKDMIFYDSNGNYKKEKDYLLENINVVGGIIGGVTETEDGEVKISNVYSTGNIYAGREGFGGADGYVEVTADNATQNNPDRVGAIYGMGYTGDKNKVNLTTNTSYFIEPDTEGGATYTTPTDYNGLSVKNGHIIDWNSRMDSSKYDGFQLNKEGVTINGDASDYEQGWRMYDNDENGMETLPMLNAFTPNTAKNESNWKDGVSGKIESVQYGTAANPLLTIINLNNTGVEDGISLNWEKLGLSGAGSLAVYGGGDLTLTEFCSDTGRYYNGILFSEGALNINAFHEGETAGADATHGFNLGSGSRLYGENVTFNAGENATTLYGDITSTNGSINIIGGDVSVIGSLTSSKNQNYRLSR